MTVKPIFLHFVNRELYQGAGVKPDTIRIYHWLEALCITQKSYLVCNIAQLYEFFYENIPVLHFLQSLQGVEFLITLSQASNFKEFIENRKEIYSFDTDRYPMYFDSEVVKSLPNIGFSQRTQIDTTLSLQSRIAAFDPEDLFATSGILSRADQEKIVPLIGIIQKITANRDGRAITSSLFRNSLNFDRGSPKDLLISRLMSGSYIGHYTSQFDAIVPSGADGVENPEIENGFPNVDLKILLHFLKLTGFYEQKFRKSNKYLSDLSSYIRSPVHVCFSDALQGLINKLYADFIASSNPNFGFQKNNPFTQISARIHIINSLSQIVRKMPQAKNVIDHIDRVHNILLVSTRSPQQPANVADLFGYVQPTGDKKTMKKILLQTATPTEDQALYDALNSKSIEYRSVAMNSFVITSFSYKDLTLYHITTNMGQSGPGSSQVIIPDIINELNVDSVIAVGICLGLDEENQNLGDVIYSSAIIDYESQKIAESGTQSRGERIYMQPKLTQFCLISARQKLPYRVHSGVYISGYKLLDQIEAISDLKTRFPDAKAGDMESYPVLNAARYREIQMICIKSICDWGYKKGDSKQKEAANNAVDYMFRVLETISNTQNNTIIT